MRLLLQFFALAAVLNASSSPSPAASTSGVADPAVTARAEAWYEMLESGGIDRSQMTQEANAAMTDDKLKQVSALLKPLGDPKSFTAIDKTSTGTATVYRYRVALASAELIFTFTLESSGKVAGLVLRTALPQPSPSNR